ncbi:MAG: CoA pyrophosphatase [Alphaproteobacteria bacterium]|nr:CoA pyrophosphatase [Alphaproteobacteria bacterium]
MERREILSARHTRGGTLTAAAVRARFGAYRPGTRSFDSDKVRGDHLLGPDAKLPPGLRPAAVLVPIVDRAEGLALLLTQRHEKLSAHAGQISLPGGRIEPTDADAVAAALRETREEIGLPSDHVEVIGRLDTYVTGTGFEIVPVVALLEPPLALAPDPGEVTEVFEVPLALVANRANYRLETRQLKNGVRTFFVLSHESRYIWGATAGILVNLAEVLAT